MYGEGGEEWFRGIDAMAMLEPLTTLNTQRLSKADTERMYCQFCKMRHAAGETTEEIMLGFLRKYKVDVEFKVAILGWLSNQANAELVNSRRTRQ